MKKLVVTITVIILILNVTKAQSNYSESIFLVSKVCEKINAPKYQNVPPSEVLSEIYKISKEIGEEYEEKYQTLLLKIKESNPSFSEKEVLKEYLKSFVFLAIEECPQYLKFTLAPFGKCPNDNEIFVLLKNETDKFIQKNSTKGILELNNLTIKHIVNTAIQNNDLAKQSYEKGIQDSKFMTDMNNYLYNKSRTFLSLTILVQIEKMTQ